MKKIINISLWIYVGIFLLLLLFRMLFNARIYFYLNPERSFDVRMIYGASVIIVLCVLYHITYLKGLRVSGLKNILTKILIVLMLFFSVGYSSSIMFLSDSSFGNYTKIRNEKTNEEYVILRSYVVRSGAITVGKLYFNCLLFEKGRVDYGCEASAEINDVRWEDEDTLIFDCAVTEGYSDESKNKTFTLTVEK